MSTGADQWSTAVPDWRGRIMAGQSLVPDLPLNEVAAEKALRIFKRLKVPDLIGTPTYGEICDDWVFDLVRAIFGAYDPETRSRALQEFFLLVPKKNGKSAIASAIILTAAIMNERPGAECFLIAPTQEIAKIAFKQAAGTIRLDPDLATIFHVREHIKVIEHRKTQAEIKILSADGMIVTGGKPTYILVDETHVLATNPRADEIFLELRGGLSVRPEGFMLQITTQSKTPPAGQFRKELMRARAVRDGRAPHRMLAILYELPPEIAKTGAWKDESTWQLVNPNLDRSVSRDWLRERLAVAEDDGPEALALFASQHFNVEIGLGLHTDRWIGAEYWEQNEVEGQTLEAILESSEVVVIGGDAGGADDLFSIGVIGRHRKTKHWQAWVRAWCLEDVLKRRPQIAPRLRDFEAEGDLVITRTAQEHVDQAADICVAIQASGKLPEAAALGLDSYGLAALLDALGVAGFGPERITAVAQGYKLTGAINGLGRRLYDGTFKPARQPLLAWSVSNAKAEQRGNNVYITKQIAGSAKIDPLLALFNAAMLMDLNPVAASAGTYLSRRQMVAV